MELEIVNFEQAKVLRELGFPQEKMYMLYTINDGVVDCVNFDYIADGLKNGRCPDDVINAPTLELVVKWLSMEYGFLFQISPNNGWVCQVHEYDEPFKNYRFPWDNEKIKNIFEISNKFNSYEEALRAGIDKVIEMLKKN